MQNELYALLAIIFLLFVSLAINLLISKSKWYKNTFEPVIYPTNDWYRKNFERNFDLISLGDYYAKMIIDYSQFDVKAFNWALDGQTLFMDKEILANFFSILKPGGYCIFPISNKNLYTIDRKPYHISRYYKKLSNYILASDERSTFLLRLYKNIPLLITLKYLIESFHKKPQVNFYSHKILNNFISQMNNINAFCLERDLKFLIVFLPYKNNEIFTPFIAELDKTYIHYLNFSNDHELLEKNSNSMLGQEGQKQFMNKFIKQIRLKD